MSVLTPLYRYHPTHDWEVVSHLLASPAPDGSVAYYQDSLSPHRADGRIPFDDEIGRAVCQYLTALAVGRGLEIVDGPYLQVLAEDWATPPGWGVVRAVVWLDEFDALTPMTDEAVSNG